MLIRFRFPIRSRLGFGFVLASTTSGPLARPSFRQQAFALGTAIRNSKIISNLRCRAWLRETLEPNAQLPDRAVCMRQDLQGSASPFSLILDVWRNFAFVVIARLGAFQAVLKNFNVLM